MDKKVSIILSTYNEALVIEETINEILENLDNVEIILVDDNSPDGTFEKVKKMNNPNLKMNLKGRKKTSKLDLNGKLQVGTYVGTGI